MAAWLFGKQMELKSSMVWLLHFIPSKTRHLRTLHAFECAIVCGLINFSRDECDDECEDSAGGKDDAAGEAEVAEADEWRGNSACDEACGTEDCACKAGILSRCIHGNRSRWREHEAETAHHGEEEEFKQPDRGTEQKCGGDKRRGDEKLQCADEDAFLRGFEFGRQKGEDADCDRVCGEKCAVHER